MIGSEELDRRRHDAWKWLLDDERGRLVIAGLLGATNPLASSMVVGDPHATAFREGQRDLGVKIYATVMEVAPEHWERLDRAMRTGSEVEGEGAALDG